VNVFIIEMCGHQFKFTQMSSVVNVWKYRIVLMTKPTGLQAMTLVHNSYVLHLEGPSRTLGTLFHALFLVHYCIATAT